MIKGIIKRMRNTLTCYRLCKHIYDNAEFHICDIKTCKARAKIGTTLDKFKKLDKKSGKGTDKYIAYLDKLLIMEEYCEGKGFIRTVWCEKTKTEIMYLTPQGLDLIDNWNIPFTPTGLWKEILKQNRVFFGIALGLLYLWSRGITLNGIVEVLRDKIGL